ncbi:unnamed protein product [Bursaphelenchus okinawaensis]|uniref:Uncharacterized protein n=1 Tax=Bursaphelenchus okinawaensis TaxID=465554 RepID=A0A811LPC0_9BILA|nr:unnamed protein product [Bursaphelenchus okinawaensis]CAG9127546.1 unnamed protein product [Bursaphelenchus okinawaensis]
MTYKGNQTEADPLMASDVIDICKAQSRAFGRHRQERQVRALWQITAKGYDQGRHGQVPSGPGAKCGVNLNPKTMVVTKVEMQGAGLPMIEFGDVLQTLQSTNRQAEETRCFETQEEHVEGK